MQGSWTVSVKYREPFSTPQRFIVAGAATGNGVYDGQTATPPVNVTGDAWSITVQHDPGTGYVDSYDQITFPTHVGSEYQFDIQANDDDVDPVFDDLILTCAMTADIWDFLVYGNASWYQGCWWNPCNPWWYVVIDSPVALANALQRPALRAAIEQLYPNRVFPPNPNPPDPGPFQPMVLPVDGRTNLPVKQAQAFQRAADTGTTMKAANDVTVTRSRVLSANLPAAASSATLSSAALAPIRNIYRQCQTGPLPEYVLRFQEYDRTPAELAGGPYTGTGPRRTLGTTNTDRNGNYIFRFTMTLADFLDELFNDTAAGENPWVSIMPDVIVQVLEGSSVIYESAPYWNIPNLDRINICVPWGQVHVGPGCTQGQIIQSIGNITVGPLVGGTRITSNTFLGTTGEITSYSSLGPQVRCAAWGGLLYLYACLDDPEIVSYVVTYKRPGTPDSGAQFVTDNYSPYHVAPAPVYWAQQSVGPTPRTLVIDGVSQTAQSYFNIETDPADGWMMRWLLLKVQINSLTCQQVLGGPGSIEFRLIGFRSDGSQVTDDRITLYVDNNGADQYISPTVRMLTTGGWVTQGNCALFTADPPNAPLEVTFRSNQYEGFEDTYTLYMYKGAAIPWAIQLDSSLPGGQYTGSYVHGSDLLCNSFAGTIDDPYYGAVTPGAVATYIQPAGGGNWLTGTETFCAFSINLSATVRITDGQTVFGPYYSGPILIGIQKA
jgi:hypothetical protein